MSYTIPAFPLSANIWHDNGLGAYQDYTLPDLIVQCNLAPGRRVVGPPFNVAFTVQVIALFPALSDLRSDFNGSAPDLAEIPAGFGAFLSRAER